MDLNLVVLAGRLTAAPDLQIVDSGTRLLRLLLSVRSEAPRKRLDVIPVNWWEPDDETLAAPPQVGQRVWVTGSVQRRFWEAPNGRRSRLEVVAEQLTLYDGEAGTPVMTGSLRP